MGRMKTMPRNTRLGRETNPISQAADRRERSASRCSARARPTYVLRAANRWIKQFDGDGFWLGIAPEDFAELSTE